MKLPTARQAKGYDILIWIDEEGDVVCRAYTTQGSDFLKTMDSRYNLGDVLEVSSTPDTFKKHVPPGMKIGNISPTTKKVHPMQISRLQ